MAQPTPGGQHPGGLRSYVDGHFLPYFGDMPLFTIFPTTFRAWVIAAIAGAPSQTASCRPRAGRRRLPIPRRDPRGGGQ